MKYRNGILKQSAGKTTFLGSSIPGSTTREKSDRRKVSAICQLSGRRFFAPRRLEKWSRERSGKNLAAITPLNFPLQGRDLRFENWIRTSVTRGGDVGHALTENTVQQRETAARRLRGEVAYSRLRHCKTSSANAAGLRSTDVDQGGTPFRSTFPDTFSMSVDTLPCTQLRAFFPNDKTQNCEWSIIPVDLSSVLTAVIKRFKNLYL